MSKENSTGAISIAPFRYALGIEYVGAAYRGWQLQAFDKVPTIQAEVERALSVIANHPVQVVCAGRTDAGVNACQQVIHFDSWVERDARAWTLGTNAHLPDDISIKWATKVPGCFHARFSARERRYRYLIYTSPTRPAILAGGVTWTHRELDVERMQEAASHLHGEHDFTSYRAVGCQARSPVREIRNLSVSRSGQLIVIDVSANAFLHHMVRNIAGVLMAVGAGQKSPDWALQVLQAKDRRQGGVTAPPDGLYFVDVRYPDLFKLPQVPLGPHFLLLAD
ncbi:tRNA pseudouridine(38-40) synthase TruA [Marinobacterium weihaiense]|uniref:tRNA pseudouridine synthase A n=1 Tax=Marinobacterium weihaiense TaxID=2851016 RepID=A0ABS6M6K5_9GAMM|nr:tRNA pseudouridine(38-40) synthase TruA [Marinobacterium weihaiense]MBV0931918.1 tRNA pseudouridine(38-40) synthase TruA [Marinobacterium weihaiense]